MPTARELIGSKTTRARQHIEQIHTMCEAYVASNPYRVTATRDAGTRRLHYVVAQVPPLNADVPLAIGDALHNLRSALDHTAYQIVLKSTNGKGPPVKKGGPFQNIYFPIVESEDRLKEAFDKRMAGAPVDVWKILGDIKPYKGGNDPLWRLSRLNNIDKHRLLLTSGSLSGGFNVGPQIAKMLHLDLRRLEAGGDLHSMNLYVRPANNLFPLKVGDVLFKSEPNAELDPKLQLSIRIAFGEPDVLDGGEIVPNLKTMADAVEDCIERLADHL